MRILLIMDPGIPVPPPFYGGHERLVAMFVDEYKKMGHEVTLLAGPGSVSQRVKHFGLNNLNRSALRKATELFEAWFYIYRNKHKFDLIHNFGRLLYLLPILSHPVKKIMTYGRDVTGSAIRKICTLPNKNLIFTACSNYCVSTGNVAGNWQTVYNAIDFSKYNLKSSVGVEAPLMFLGRIEQIKGVHTAVELAIKTGNKLWIGGNIAAEHMTYYRDQIEPYVDNEQIIYLGPLNDNQKNEYLGRSKALLFPIEWDEPFGMVMVEAMACGTPVIAYKRGSVPEVVEDGINGYSGATIQELITKIEKIPLIDRANCRQYAAKRFDVSVIAKHYLNLFKQRE